MTIFIFYYINISHHLSICTIYSELFLPSLVYLSCFYKQLLKILRKKNNKNVLKQKDKNKEVIACPRRKKEVSFYVDETVSCQQKPRPAY